MYLNLCCVIVVIKKSSELNKNSNNLKDIWINVLYIRRD